MRSSFELLDQQVSGSFGDLQDLQVTCVEQTIIWLNHVSLNHGSIYSGQGFFRDLVYLCCEWSFLWESCSWCYLLHKHHIDPPVCLKQSARHNLHAALGGRKQADMRGNEEMWVRRWYCDLLLVKLDSGVTSEMFGSSKQSLSPWWVCGLGSEEQVKEHTLTCLLSQDQVLSTDWSALSRRHPYYCDRKLVLRDPVTVSKCFHLAH